MDEWVEDRVPVMAVDLRYRMNEDEAIHVSLSTEERYNSAVMQQLALTAVDTVTAAASQLSREAFKLAKEQDGEAAE